MRKRLIWSATALLVIIVVIGSYYFIKNIKNTMAYKILEEEYVKPVPVKNIAEEYDVIVIGGEPEGVAAAVSSARNGAKTLLVESREELGGLFTYGMLNFLDIPRDENRQTVSKGIYEQWHQLVKAEDAFGILGAKAAFKKLIDEEPNLTLTTQTEVVQSILNNNRVTSVKLKNKYGLYEVKGKTFIDATQDADFAAKSNVPYFIGGEDIGIKDKKMAVTLMLHLKNVDWQKVKSEAKSNTFGGADITEPVVWGFTELHDSYKPVEENVRLRGLNLAKADDEYYINALQIFGINGLDEQSKQEAIEKGKRETKHILRYLQEEFPGFENAEIVSYPEELYVRETRHIWAEYQLPMSDIWTNKDHWDSIGIGAYPVDVQAQTPHDYGYVISTPKQYAIPFRSLVPKDIDGLLVVGRSAGYSSLAAGSARIVPTGMVVGEAAGAAAALAVENEVTFREMSKNKKLIKTLRETLDEQGAYVDHYTIDYPYEGKWYDESIQTLINYGLVVGGYSNDLKVNEPATKLRFANMLKEGIQRANPEKMKQVKDKVDAVYYKVYDTGNDPITRDEVATYLTEVLFDTSSSSSWELLAEKGVITEDLAERISADKELKLKEMYAINAALVNYVKKGSIQ